MAKGFLLPHQSMECPRISHELVLDHTFQLFVQLSQPWSSPQHSGHPVTGQPFPLGLPVVKLVHPQTACNQRTDCFSQPFGHGVSVAVSSTVPLSSLSASRAFLRSPLSSANAGSPMPFVGGFEVGQAGCRHGLPGALFWPSGALQAGGIAGGGG